MTAKNTIRTVRAILVSIVWIYVALFVLLNMPPVRKAIAGRTAALLSDFLDTEISIGSINPGFLNNVTIDDLSVKDRQGKDMLKAARMAATINIKDLINGQVTLEGVQLFSIDANLRKSTPTSEPNFQFIVDALSSDNEEKKPLRLKLSSIILRHANINYDIESEPLKKGLLDTNHIHIKDAALTAAITIKEGELFSFIIRRLDAIETNSGLSIIKFTANAKAVADGMTLTRLALQSNAADISIDSANIAYTDWSKDNKWSFTTAIKDCRFSPQNLQCLIPELRNINTDIKFQSEINGSNDGWTVDNLHLTSPDESIIARLNASYFHATKEKDMLLRCDIDTLYATSDRCAEIARTTGANDSLVAVIRRLGNVGIKGLVNKNDAQWLANTRVTTDSGVVAMQGVAHLKDSTTQSYRLNLTASNINIGHILNNPELGSTSFDIATNGTWNRNKTKLPTASAKATISQFDYKGYTYRNITVNASSKDSGCTATAHLDDENLRLNLFGEYHPNASQPSYACKASIKDFNPHALNLTNDYANETVDLNLTAKVKGRDICNATGTIRLDSIHIFTPSAIYINDSLVISQTTLTKESASRQLLVQGDFINAEIKGRINLATIANSTLLQLSHQIPAIFRTSKKRFHNDFAYDIKLRHSEMLCHLLQKDYDIAEPINIAGRIDDKTGIMDLYVQGSKVRYEKTTYRDISMNCKNTADRLSLSAKVSREEEKGLTHITAIAKASNNTVDTQLAWESDMTAEPYKGLIDAKTSFDRQNNTLSTNIDIKHSDISIKDMTWSLHPSSVTLSDNKVTIKNFKASHDEQYIMANGAVSKFDNDSLNIDLCELPIEYLQDLVNFHAVDFAGLLSGQATLKSLYSSTPHIEAQVTIDDMLFKRGRMGDANLHVWQNETSKGINIQGIINDTTDCYTGVDGFISPADKEIDLHIATHNTSAEFLNGLIGSIFKDISGRVNGDLRVCGPLNDINLVGNVATNVNLTLRPTNVRYQIEGDTLHFRKYRFGFDDVVIKDTRGNLGIVNGSITHKNFKNFGYTLNVDMHNLLCYDEQEFNSDKFYATVFANGNVLIKGADKEPLNINGSVTTGRESVFAYDAATPDAISNANFITFRDRTPKKKEVTPIPYAKQHETTTSQNAYNYSGDIRMNLNIALNNNCEIKLRMDNTEDGYMSTYGHGNIQAIYHNKSPFKLHGTYHIDRGSYRLFLQDPIYRDLAIQGGSQVDFDGDPFAAELHLICHHTLNSVPLSDLTASTAYSYNNKVKVICILDITGTLASMDFKFDLDLPNVNEETKQLVRSMINSEEERNTQLIYLLGLGRFYPNEYARAANEDNNSSAVSSLMASTLSGQINQMLSNAIGKDSKWNFGTGLSTGERGWEDLDVEGILSGRLFNDRLLINGNFGYRDNSLTQTSNFVGDFDVRWKITETGNTYLKAYNQANDRYFTKATLNTQGIGISYERDFETWTDLFRFLRKRKKTTK